MGNVITFEKNKKVSKVLKQTLQVQNNTIH